MPRHAHVVVDLAAVEHNASLLASLAAPSKLCAVVKADGYGHGAVAVASAALRGGAALLAVALVEEGVALREAGIDAPVLVLSEPPHEDLGAAREAGLTPMLYTPELIAAAARVSASTGGRPWEVHLKVDTGMHRVGCAPSDALALAKQVLAEPSLRLGGTATHLAVADEPDRPETTEQLARFEAVLEEMVSAGVEPGCRHASNSAGALAHPPARMDMVRCGIALFGIPPSSDIADRVPEVAGLRPAMSVRSEVSFVKEVAAGEGVSYGLCHTFDHPAVLATVPVGYADGVRRDLGTSGGEVLIGGVRRPLRGVVTMDQLVVEVTGGPEVRAGDEVVLIGRQGGDEVTVGEWARILGTIPYEVVTGFGPRLPRRYSGAP